MKLFGLVFSVMTFVIVASIISVNMWGEKEEIPVAAIQLEMTSAMTVAEFGETNTLSRQLLKKVFTLESPDQMQNLITSFGMSPEQISKKVNKFHTLESEDATKNWIKIPLKFTLWFLFMTLCFFLLRKKKLNKKSRMILYGLGFTIFGVILGADPSPMGTVKDAIVLYSSKGVIFKPRLIAFAIFTATVVFANKFICSWGCQLGTLQDFIFRLNRNRKDSGRGRLPQFKIPFIVSNSIRILFFIALIWIAVVWAYDITHEIDPFKIFKPMKVSVPGWLFITITLIFSLFVYRPWCHLFCPFGLTSWLFEKLSFFRIKVDYEKCISCFACESSCPSPVMGTILRGDKSVIPDCFSCGNCIDSCPTDAVSFAFGRNGKPPVGKLRGPD
ncbi:4Fe-4S binding protein [Geopsychrobacter electrodiphilus]|uniref:4Fe-4S binding protein n=1 Tax=Geopsychrobacter electrodiphilus TaxID=225196 RepID=UPI0003803A93|nr:4Fe-4S binding protein [Geopsychrobacter electrodiphilus]